MFAPVMRRAMTILLGLALLSGGPPRRSAAADEDPEIVETQESVPTLTPPAAYQPKGDVIEVELSQYAGYAGLIVANGGLEPNDESFFAKKYGFKVHLTLSEEESWPALNSGKMAASATTVDVLAAYGPQFDVVVPALIGFSRGADAVLVRKDIKNINGLRGLKLATSQFTEADFFIRYLAQEADMKVNLLQALADEPDPDKVNLIFCEDAFKAGELFLRDVTSGKKRLAGCVTWEPTTSEVVTASNGAVRTLVTSSNLLIIGDIMVVNAGFAKANPKMVEGLVAGLLEGNSQIRANPQRHGGVIAKGLGLAPEGIAEELAKVHLANLPENIAFFNETIDSAGSFGYIFNTAAGAYGSDLARGGSNAKGFLSLTALKAIEQSGVYQDQVAAITPIHSEDSSGESIEPIVKKQIVFQFRANKSELNTKFPGNQDGLTRIADLLRISPGSTVWLRGHAEGTQIEEARKKYGEAGAGKIIMRLKTLSKQRCDAVKELLVSRYAVKADRIKTEGVGADEPTGKGRAADRRVETLWSVLN